MIITGDRVALPVRRPVLFAFLQKMLQLQQLFFGKIFPKL